MVAREVGWGKLAPTEIPIAAQPDAYWTPPADVWLNTPAEPLLFCGIVKESIDDISGEEANGICLLRKNQRFP